jgi:hypothetical protein
MTDTRSGRLMAYPPKSLPTPLGNLSTYLTGADDVEATCQTETVTPRKSLPDPMTVDGSYLSSMENQSQNAKPALHAPLRMGG